MKNHGTVSEKAAWYMVGVLTLAYMFSFIDRQILSLMVGPIQRDLGLTDTQFSLLHGFAFALFYTFMGIPIARLADTRSRRTLIAAGIAIWSIATTLGGFARNFVQLFTARIAVGVGEAALSPAAYSLLADQFPREKLGRAISIYSSGVYLGIGLSFILGGVLVAGLEAAGGLTVPLLGTLKSWQATFMIVGLPGLLIALLVLTFKEPPRTALHAVVTPSTTATRQIIDWISHHRFLYASHFIGFALVALLFNAIMAWAPEFFIRIHGLERGDIGIKLGLITAIFGGAGIVCGGLYTDFLSRRGDLAAPMRAGMAGAAMLTPLAVAAPLVPDPQVSLILFCPMIFFASFPFGPAASALQMVTPPRMRAQISAVYLFFVNLLGIGFGGTATALVTDFVFRDSMMLHYSMATNALLAGTFAVVLLALSIKPFRHGHTEVLEALK
jgi:MFS family permease